MSQGKRDATSASTTAAGLNQKRSKQRKDANTATQRTLHKNKSRIGYGP